MDTIIQDERWMPIKGYESLYEISDYGRIKSHNTRTGITEILTPTDNGNGYLIIGLHVGNKKKNHYIHRLVAEAFCENKDNKPLVHHKDENKKNNHYSNLAWVTKRENALFSIGSFRIRHNVKTNTGERYISKQKSDGRYRVTIDYKQLGTFKTLEEAIVFRNERWKSRKVLFKTQENVIGVEK